MNSRDRAIADEAGVELSLMCAAGGCPNRWSVDAGNGRLCSAHAWISPEDWAAATRREQDAETDRARGLFDAPMPSTRRFTHEEKRQILAKLRDAFSPNRNPRAWAHRLKAREQSGEKLNDRQRAAWRNALSASAPTTEETS